MLAFLSAASGFAVAVYVAILCLDNQYLDFLYNRWQLGSENAASYADFVVDAHGIRRYDRVSDYLLLTVWCGSVGFAYRMMRRRRGLSSRFAGDVVYLGLNLAAAAVLRSQEEWLFVHRNSTVDACLVCLPLFAVWGVRSTDGHLAARSATGARVIERRMN